jgi:hypothetical protein
LCRDEHVVLVDADRQSWHSTGQRSRRSLVNLGQPGAVHPEGR